MAEPGFHLVIVRHAHAEDAQDGMSDFDRPISKRGKHEADVLDKVIPKFRIPMPNAVFSSGAKRAEQTRERLSCLDKVSRRDIVRTQTLLSDADPVPLFQEIRDFFASGGTKGTKAGHSENCAWIFGHNPNLDRLVAALSPSLKALVDQLEKASILWIEWPSLAVFSKESPRLRAYIPRPDED